MFGFDLQKLCPCLSLIPAAVALVSIPDTGLDFLPGKTAVNSRKKHKRAVLVLA